MNKFANIVLYFILWVAITTGIFYLLLALNWPRALVLLPAVGGLALFFYINRKN